MTLPKPITIVCVSSYFKGNTFIETCKKEGCTVILLTIENGSPDAIALENSTDGRIVIPVSRRDLRAGVFRYDGVIRSRRAGSFAVTAAVVPLLAAVSGEDLPAQTASSRASAALLR